MYRGNFDPDNIISEQSQLPGVLPIDIDTSTVTTQPTVFTEPPQSANINDRPVSHHRLAGLTTLAVTDLIVIDVEQRRLKCDWDVKYYIRNGITEHDETLFKAKEELRCCEWNSLQNVVVLDKDDNPIARVCYKERNCLFGKLVLAVYSPVDNLVGTAEEFPQFCMLSSEYKLRNADGNELFTIECRRSLFSSVFIIKVADGSETEVAEIFEKTSARLQIQFKAKMSAQAKMILLGFCIGNLHKSSTIKPD